MLIYWYKKHNISVDFYTDFSTDFSTNIEAITLSTVTIFYSYSQLCSYIITKRKPRYFVLTSLGYPKPFNTHFLKARLEPCLYTENCSTFRRKLPNKRHEILKFHTCHLQSMGLAPANFLSHTFTFTSTLIRGTYRKSWATNFCKVTCFIIDKPNTSP